MVHSAYKLVRDAREVPPRKWLQIGQMAAVFKVLPNTMLPMCRLFDAFEAIIAINEDGLSGDVVECGVWNGGCVGLMALANSKLSGPSRKFHLFDSFEGLPQPSSYDIDVLESFKEKHPGLSLSGASDLELHAIGACVGDSQPAVEKFLVRRLGLQKQDLIFHKGWFQETVPRSDDTLHDIALLRIDGDWYDSTKVCLEGLYDKVVRNGFIIIDDYGTFAGCRQATDEFLRRKGVTCEMRSSDHQCMFFRKP